MGKEVTSIYVKDLNDEGSDIEVYATYKDKADELLVRISGGYSYLTAGLLANHFIAH
jgi:hypothetical protein